MSETQDGLVVANLTLPCFPTSAQETIGELMENAGMPRQKKSRRIASAMRLLIQCVTHQPRNWRKTAVLLATGSFFAHRPFTRTRKLLLVANGTSTNSSLSRSPV